MRALPVFLLLVFAGTQTMAQADCCCTAPDVPKAGAPTGNCCRREARTPPESPQSTDCGCERPQVRGDVEPAPAVSVAPDLAHTAPASEAALAVTSDPSVLPRASEHGPPDRDIGPLHLRFHVLLV